MSRSRTKHRKVIELFDEKTVEVVRTICFHSPKEFEKFIKDFKGMRYSDYGWRYKDKGERRKNETLSQ